MSAALHAPQCLSAPTGQQGPAFCALPALRRHLQPSNKTLHLQNLGANHNFQRTRKCRHAAQALAAAAADLQVPEVKPGEKVTWYAVLANAQFMVHDVQNEAFAEQLRERRRYLKEKSIPENFFLVSEPTWLDKQFPEQAKRIRRPCVALVSTDKLWIKFMKLRLDRVLELTIPDLTPEEALKAGAPIPDFQPLDKAEKWTAPYPPYAPGWWDTFVPKA